METINKKQQEAVGKWLINSDGYYPYCSICLEEPSSGIMTDECPNCGAMMIVEDRFKNINVHPHSTNANYIRSLNNKELSYFLMSDWFVNNVCKNCEGEFDRCGDFKYCESKILEWLLKEKQ